MAPASKEIVDLEGAIRTYTCFRRLDEVPGIEAIRSRWTEWDGTPHLRYAQASGHDCRVMPVDKAREFIIKRCPELVEAHQKCMESGRKALQREIDRLKFGIERDQEKIVELQAAPELWV